MLPFDRFELAVFFGPEETLVVKIPFFVGLGLIVKDQVSEKLLFLFVEFQAGHEFDEALLGEIPVSIHDKLEKVGRLETGPFREGTVRKRGTGFFGGLVPVPQEFSVIQVLKKVDRGGALFHDPTVISTVRRRKC
jgi:hypothetical protein